MVKRHSVVFSYGEIQDLLLSGFKPYVDGRGQHGRADEIVGAPAVLALFPWPPAGIPLVVLLSRRLFLDHQNLVIAQVPKERILWVWARGKREKNEGGAKISEKSNSSSSRSLKELNFSRNRQAVQHCCSLAHQASLKLQFGISRQQQNVDLFCLSCPPRINIYKY